MKFEWFINSKIAAFKTYYFHLNAWILQDCWITYSVTVQMPYILVRSYPGPSSRVVVAVVGKLDWMRNQVHIDRQK